MAEATSAVAHHAHVVLLPLPGQSHLNPMVTIARFLADLDISVTLAVAARSHASLMAAVAASGQDSLSSCKSNIRVEVLPDGLPADPKVHVREPLRASFDMLKQSAHDLLHRLLHQAQPPTESAAPSHTWSAPCCIIVDCIFIWGQELARRFDLPQITLWTSSASSLSVGIHAPDLVARGYLPAKSAESLERNIDFLPGLSSLCIADLPETYLMDEGLQSPLGQFLRVLFEQLKGAERVLVNSNYELEKEVMEALRVQDGMHIVPVGPLFLMDSSSKKGRRAFNLLAEDRSCLSWLDKQEKASVLYISFGTVCSIEGQVYEELAHGLEASGERFLWVVRPGEHEEKGSTAPSMEEVLPQGFMQRTAARGLVVSWAPQLEVLAHPSVAAFLSHCGWNSVLESLSNGVPMLGFPQQLDQRGNLKHLVHDWEAAIPLLPTSCGQRELQRSHVQGAVMAIMRGEEAESTRKRALEWRGKLASAGCMGSRSMSNLLKLADDIKSGHLK